LPEPPSDEQLSKAARQQLQQERFAAAREALLRELEQRIESDTDSPPWHIGRWTLHDEMLRHLWPAGAGDEERERLRERFLLAEEALARDLESAEMVVEVDHRLDRLLLSRVFDLRRQELDETIGEDRLRPFFDAQPSLFGEPSALHLDLLFVPQGHDSYSSQKRVEGHVADLRAGRVSFADLARRESRGPGAENGGDLGFLTASEWSRLGPAVSAAVPELETGRISDPIYCTARVMSPDSWMLRGGFAVLRVRERRPERMRSFEEAIEDVRRAYGSEQGAELDLQLRARALDEAGFRILRLPSTAELSP
ncbi:MAG: peptidyl-prolyl cis-trans isomerase, partial [Holophagales bacterium]|nr:peptidyl-prolyl cis-trans isomerase [Holophagales bacterium]